MSDFFRLFV